MAPSPEAANKFGCFSLLLILLLSLCTSSNGINGQESSPSEQPSPAAAVADGASPPSVSSSPASSSFVLADPNIGAPQSAFSPSAESNAISSPSSSPSSSSSSHQPNAPSTAGVVSSPGQQQSSMPSAPSDGQIEGTGTGGYGSMMLASPSLPASAATGGGGGGDPLGMPMGDSPQEQIQSNGQVARMADPNAAKRHQFSQYPDPGGAGLGPAGPAPAAGVCPGGASLPIECDPKRPWPQCPPQSYCYATNTVDIGPYFCCPIWSTYGAAWRPATPFYSYAPPPPPNWPEPMRMAAAPAYGGPMAPIRKGRKEQRFDDDGAPLMTQEEQRKILQVMNDWVERQKSSGGGGGGEGEEAKVVERTPPPPAAAEVTEAAPAEGTAAGVE